MATITTTELIETGEKRDALGRRHTPAQRRAALLTAYRTSGLTESALARREVTLARGLGSADGPCGSRAPQDDTNAVENALRPGKLGARKWIFTGHPEAGDRTAVRYSFIVSAKRRGFNLQPTSRTLSPACRR